MERHGTWLLCRYHARGFHPGSYSSCFRRSWHIGMVDGGIGVMVGALFLNVLDLVTPHLHHITGLDEEQHRNNASLNHILLFCLSPYSFWHVSFSCFAEPLTSIPPLSPLNRKKRVSGTHFLSEGGVLIIFMLCLGISLKFIPGLPMEFTASFYSGLGPILLFAAFRFMFNHLKNR